MMGPRQVEQDALFYEFSIALPVDSAVLDGEVIILRSDHTSDFEALRSRQRQAEAVRVPAGTGAHVSSCRLQICES